MKTVILIAMWMAMALCTHLFAQDTIHNSKIVQLKKTKEEIVVSEKNKLKKEVEKINQQLIDGEITKEKAIMLKEAAANKRALNIENQLTIIDNKIALLIRNGEAYEEVEERNKIEKEIEIFGFKINGNNSNKKEVYDRRTNESFVIAFGLNNVLTEGTSLEDSDYRIGGSRFFEMGIVWKTRIFEKSNFARVLYGISYQSNGLKPTGNRYLVDKEGQTVLEEFRVGLDKSKFRVDHLVVPLYLEFGPSKFIETPEKIRYRIHKKFRIGVGGYAGLNISTRQKLKYIEEGEKVKEKIKMDYNTSNFVYGLGGYLGFGDMSLYAKYDMSPLFKNAVVKQNNISLGVRFDL
ncbi:hypothetical protein HN014_10410 [Aquimarina sp. TRL1]|uniref:hypothetical protein n=1 Tax=Aquimarina sp. (strain TRL1) TaxID=2736252 RepID=UPI00158AD5D4|nr:hypothetical protein [Aquimarina sp. TRL1]QKX05312.1 hypothetical protein HN014_10410 [Aquimarina sp. TRL1]